MITLEDKIKSYIKRSRREAFLRTDFDGFGGYDQVGRALRGLIKSGFIVRIGYGAYAKARPSTITGKPVPKSDLYMLAFRLYERLGASPRPSRAMQSYNEGSTQIPMTEKIRVSANVTRKFKCNKREIGIER